MARGTSIITRILRLFGLLTALLSIALGIYTLAKLDQRRLANNGLTAFPNAILSTNFQDSNWKNADHQGDYIVDVYFNLYFQVCSNAVASILLGIAAAMITAASSCVPASFKGAVDAFETLLSGKFVLLGILALGQAGAFGFSVAIISFVLSALFMVAAIFV